MGVRVLTWNLMHGRAVPPAGHDLQDEFIAALARWEWDVAVLQEVPPWWPPALAGRLDAEERTILTSRNALLPLRRAIAERRPELIKSNGGGANAILVRARPIRDHRKRLLRLLPERRWVHGVLLDGEPPLWVANLHLSGRPRAATNEAAAAARTLLSWAAGAPALLGGDFNLPAPAAPGFEPAGGHGVDHFLVCGLRPSTEPELLVRGVLSDHVPVAVELATA